MEGDDASEVREGLVGKEDTYRGTTDGRRVVMRGGGTTVEESERGG